MPRDGSVSFSHGPSISSLLARIQFAMFALYGSGFAGPEPPAYSGDCPRACFCNTLNKIVYCSRRGLTSVPDGIPDDSVQLNVNGNQFQSTSIQRSNFSSYRRLEHLYMSECGIERIQMDTFADLVFLKWLDLSNNRLKVLKENTFRGVSLQHLFLNGNRNIQLVPGSFVGLETTGLYLHDCSLSDIHPDVLYPLNETLRYLWLNGNELDRLDQRFLGLFSSLMHLRLGSNPLRCSCDAVWLKEFFDKRGDVFRGAPAPSCLTPFRLKGKYFNDSSVFDFRCQAPMFKHVEAAFNGTFGRLRCAAIGDPAPTLYWIQPSGKATKYASPDDLEIRDNEGILELNVANSPDDVRLYGMFICVANNNVGNVSLTINIPSAASGTSGSGLQYVEQQNSLSRTSPSATQVNRKTSSTIASTNDRINNFTPTTSRRISTSGQRSSGMRSDSPTALQRLNEAETNSIRGPTSGNISTLEGHEREGSPLGQTSWSSRRFTLSEMAGAVVGTHVGTMIVYALVFVLCYWGRCRTKRHMRRIHQRNALFFSHKTPPVSPRCRSPPPLPEAVYLNGMGHRHHFDYSHYTQASPVPRR